ncbi:MAG: glycosyltransferase family 39 protein [Cyanobacteria bacterium P01_A01_bin.123]
MVKQQVRGVSLLIAVLLVLGIVGRFTNLAHKLYWHDEVYTTFRAAGYFAEEILDRAFQGEILPASELQTFQQLKPDSTVVDTLQSLALEDPQHPPLYFLLARGWMQLFGNTIVIARILPALLSLLSLPLMYQWAKSVFQTTSAAWWSTVMLALSPFDILYAQAARQYSLLTVCAIASHWRFMRALQYPTWVNWGLYTVVSTLGLYTHPLFALVPIAHGAYGAIAWVFNQWPSPDFPRASRRSSGLKRVVSLFAAFGLMGLLYSPWIWVIRSNNQTFQLATGWTQQSIPLLELIKLWIRNFGALWIDFDFDLTAAEIGIVGLGLKLLALLVLPLALWYLWQHLPRSQALYLITIIFVPFLLLAIPDVTTGGVRSVIGRYVLPIMPGLQLAVGGWLSRQIQPEKRLWRIGLPLLLTGSIASNVISLPAETWWNKEPSFYNAAVAKQINSVDQPLVVSDQGSAYTNFGNLLSLSYRLDEDVQLLLRWQSTDFAVLETWPSDRPAFAYKPSAELVAYLEDAGWQLTPAPLNGQPVGDELFELNQ